MATLNILKRAREFFTPADSAPELSESYAYRLQPYLSGNADPNNLSKTATASAAIGLISEAVSNSIVSVEAEFANPQFLRLTARNLLISGDAVWYLLEGSILPVAVFDIKGGRDPADWRYKLTIHTPETSLEVKVEPTEVLHFKINESADQHWRGRSPAEVASATAQILIGVESALLAEQKLPSFAALVASAGLGATAPDTGNLRAFAQQSGSFGVIESPNRDRSLANDFELARVRPESAESQIRLQESLRRQIASVYSVPLAILEGAGGTASREANRHFLKFAVEPITREIGRELSAKLGRQVTLDVSNLRQTDLTARARALKQLTDAGVSLPRAMAICGFEAE